MTPELVRFIQNTQAALRNFTRAQLYELAVSLRHELALRETDAVPEADALVAALLADARAEHRAIFSGDCSVPDTQLALAQERMRLLGRVPAPPAKES